MRVAVGVVSIMISGFMGLFGLAMAADGVSGAAAGKVQVRVVDVWKVDDETCPTAIRVSYQRKSGVYDCAEPDVKLGDSLTLYRSYFDDSFGTRGDQITFIVMGGLLAAAMFVVAGSVGWLILKEVGPGTPPYGASVIP